MVLSSMRFVESLSKRVRRLFDNQRKDKKHVETHVDRTALKGPTKVEFSGAGSNARVAYDISLLESVLTGGLMRAQVTIAHLRMMATIGLLVGVGYYPGMANATPKWLPPSSSVQVVDSSSPPVVVGEVIGVDQNRDLFVAISSELINADPPLVVKVLLQSPSRNASGFTLMGTEILYYTDSACLTTPYFTVAANPYGATGVITTSSSGPTTTYQIYTPATGAVEPQKYFNARRDPTGPQAFNIMSCDVIGQPWDAFQAIATPYSITLTPPLKMKAP